MVTIGSRRDYGEFDTIESFATGLFNAWGVGSAARNDGIMVLVANVDRAAVGGGGQDVHDQVQQALAGAAEEVSGEHGADLVGEDLEPLLVREVLASDPDLDLRAVLEDKRALCQVASFDPDLHRGLCAG